MEELKAELAAKGGTEADWRDFLSEGLALEDLEEYEAGYSRTSPLEHAQRVLGSGRIIEYACYDDHWRPQGRALLEVVKYDDEKKGTILGRHVKASDEYYQWYAETTLSEDGAVYHLCDCDAKACKFKLRSRDRRELMHVSEWKVMSPGMMLTSHYSKEVAYERLRKQVNQFVPHPVAPPRVEGGGDKPKDDRRGGTGLDEVLEGNFGGERAPRGATPAKVLDQPRGSVGELLKRKAEEHLASASSKRKPEKRRKRRSEADRLARRKRKDAEASDSESSSGDSAGSGEMDFRQPPTRGGEELWRQSKKHPGRLLKEGMKELSRYLADRAGDGGQEEWSQRRVMAYINQVLLQQGGPQGIGLRNQREAVTLGTCLDHLLSGDLPALGDTLMQRLKALESSIQDQGWQSARHLEIIPPQAASLASMEEKDRAAKQELRMIKLRGAMSRVKSPK